jgi:glycosyltransferase involved in cell wall biosynthesis
MTDSPLRVLVISYVFPPYAGIGGRRWAKFAKCMHQSGIPVEVLCAENPLKERSVWMNDIEGLSMHRFRSAFPVSLLGVPSSLLQKLQYRMDLARVQSRVRGNYYDRAGADRDVVVARASAIIAAQKTTHVIVTGAPFHLLHHCLELKKKFPHIVLAGDIRDPWTSDKTISSFAQLEAARQQTEMQMEREMIEGYDRIYTVADAITEEYNSRSPRKQSHTLINGFDPSDKAKEQRPAVADDRSIHLVFAGTLYNSLGDAVTGLVSGLRSYNDSSRDDARKVVLHLAGSIPSAYSAQFAALKGLPKVEVREAGKITLEQTQQLIASAGMCVLIIARGFEFSFSTKFLEYVMNEKPLLVISEEGALPEFVRNQRIGYTLTPAQLTSELAPLLREFDEKTMHYTAEQVKFFDVREITRTLISDLYTLKPNHSTAQ